jgi:hypothetical protein
MADRSAPFEIDVPLLAHQWDFLSDTESRYLVLEGGLASGKSVSAVLKMVQLARLNAPCAGLMIEPTYGLIRDILLPTIAEFFPQWGIPYHWHKTDHILTLTFGRGKARQKVPIFFRSGDAPERIVGFKVGWFILDEHDLLKEEVFKRAVGRARDKRATVPQRCAVGTPEEGFHWTYQRFHEKPAAGTRVIEGASTASNIFIDDAYAEDLAEQHDDDERERVLTGKRCQRGGRVYRAFDRARHCRPCANPTAGDVEVWADFNVGKMHWCFARVLGDEAHVFGEVVSVDTDTYEQTQRAAAVLADVYSKHLKREVTPYEAARMTTVVCDAAGQARKTSATDTDVAIVRKAGFHVMPVGATNPLVRDRVNSVNLRFRGMKLYLDDKAAPETAKCIEQQGRGTDGAPAKDKDPKKDLSGGADAVGYGVYRRWPARVAVGNSYRFH